MKESIEVVDIQYIVLDKMVRIKNKGLMREQREIVDKLFLSTQDQV